MEFRDDMQPYDYDEEQLKRVVGIYLQTDDVDEAYRMMRRQGLICGLMPSELGFRRHFLLPFVWKNGAFCGGCRFFYGV